MSLLYRFGVVALLAGLLAGLLLRVATGRRPFALLTGLAFLPLAAHAAYLLVLAARASLPRGPMLAFAAAALVLVALGVVLGRAWVVARPWLAVLTPVVAAPVYAVLATVTLAAPLESHAYAPSALAGAAYGLATLFAGALLAPFAPGAWAPGGPRPPRGRG